MPDQTIRETDPSAGHKPNCHFRMAVRCRIGVECEHGFDVCPICDPCTCHPTENPNDPKEAARADAR